MCVKLYYKISILGVDFDQYFYVSIDFVLNTQIESIGQNQPPKSILFREILHTAVNTNVNIHMVKRNYTFAQNIWFYKLIS